MKTLQDYIEFAKIMGIMLIAASADSWVEFIYNLIF